MKGRKAVRPANLWKCVTPGDLERIRTNLRQAWVEVADEWMSEYCARNTRGAKVQLLTQINQPYPGTCRYPSFSIQMHPYVRNEPRVVQGPVALAACLGSKQPPGYSGKPVVGKPRNEPAACLERADMAV